MNIISHGKIAAIANNYYQKTDFLYDFSTKNVEKYDFFSNYTKSEEFKIFLLIIMAMEYLTYKYIIYPTKNQKQRIDENIQFCSFLRQIYKKDLANHRELPYLAKDILDIYISEYPLLEKAGRMILMREIFRINEGETRNSFSFANTSFMCRKYPIEENRFFIPNIGWVRKGYYRKNPLVEFIKFYTITRYGGKYYLLITHCTQNKKKILNPSSIIGFDYSSTHFLVDNNGKLYDIPRFQKEVMARIKRKTKRLKGCKQGSNTYKRLKKEIGKTYIYSKNKRLDYLHKMSSSIVKQYDYIVIEDLSMREIASDFNLYKATYDNSFYKFTEMLRYKAVSQGKKLIKVNKYFPSTKLCHKCGNINNNLTINDRSWVCPGCGTLLDRDVNSAINIKNEGLRIIADGRSACQEQIVL